MRKVNLLINNKNILIILDIKVVQQYNVYGVRLNEKKNHEQADRMET